MQLLLISSSFVDGKGYLGHCRESVQEFLQSCPEGEVVFIPYATYRQRWEEYRQTSQKFFDSIDQPMRSLHTCDDPAAYIRDAKIKAIFVTGGNTFLLLKTLQDLNLLEPIKERVKNGVGYMGTSAGINVACPTIQTTNDMPIVDPVDFKALNFVNFQVNAHYIPGVPTPGFQGESREERIGEYHVMNETPVIGLPEPTWIRVRDDNIRLEGEKAATVFEKGLPERVWHTGTELYLGAN